MTAKAEHNTSGNTARSPAPEIGRRTAAGFAWTFTQGILERGVSAVGQLVLAYLLVPKDFDLVALVYTVTTFATQLQQFGLKNVLVQRRPEWDRWVTPAFWMSAALGVVACVATVMVSPWVARLYQKHELIDLLLVASLSFPIASIATVPEARLSADLRFRLLSRLGAIMSISRMALSILLAWWLDWGAMSIIAAQPIGAFIRFLLAWLATKPKIQAHFEVGKWRSIAGVGGVMLVTSVLAFLTVEGPRIVLGTMEPAGDLTGLLYFAFSLSDQGTRMLMVNLGSVLMPALSTLVHEPERQAKGFERAVRSLLLVGLPLCGLQAVMGAPAFRLLLEEKWHTSILMFIVFSVAMFGRLTAFPCDAFLLAQHRQNASLLTMIVYTPLFIGLCILGVIGGRWAEAHGVTLLGLGVGPAEGCTIAIAVGMLIYSPIAMYIALYRVRRSWFDVLRIYARPTVGSLLSCGVAAWILRALPNTTRGDIIGLVQAPIVVGILYSAWAWWFARGDVLDLFARVKSLVPKRLGEKIAKLAGKRGDAVELPAREAPLGSSEDAQIPGV
ncbi:MAG: oligosaccharide flippase family protein [Phycisphaerales bacterium]